MNGEGAVVRSSENWFMLSPTMASTNPFWSSHDGSYDWTMPPLPTTFPSVDFTPSSSDSVLPHEVNQFYSCYDNAPHTGIVLFIAHFQAMLKRLYGNFPPAGWHTYMVASRFLEAAAEKWRETPQYPLWRDLVFGRKGVFINPQLQVVGPSRDTKALLTNPTPRKMVKIRRKDGMNEDAMVEEGKIPKIIVSPPVPRKEWSIIPQNWSMELDEEEITPWQPGQMDLS